MSTITIAHNLMMERVLTIEIVRVTERAAVSAARLRGHGKSKASDQAAVDAVRQWRYTPSLYYGKPVSVLMTITVRFTLHQ